MGIGNRVVISRRVRGFSLKRALFSCMAAILIASNGGLPVQARDLLGNFAAETSAYNLCLQADRYLSNSQYAEARDVLLKAATYDPTSYSALVHRDLASAYAGLKQNDAAIRELKTALRFNPALDYAMYKIASIYLEMERYEDARNWFKRYVDAQSTPEGKAQAEKSYREMAAYSLVRSGDALIEKKRDSAAIKLLDEAATFDPSPYSASIHSDLCFALQRSGRAERAVGEGKKALQYEPNRKETVYTIARAYEDLAQFDNAVSWMRRYLEMESDPAQRQSAQNFLESLTEDMNQSKNSANNSPDYLSQVCVERGRVRWPTRSLPIKVYIASSGPGYRPSFSDYIKKSLDTWCQATGGRIDYAVVNNPSQADMKISWTKSQIDQPTTKGHLMTEGQTNAYSQGGDITEATIVVLTVDPFTAEPVEDGVCATICMHEVGHALGLDGHSTSIRDIMYYRSCNKRSFVPTARDKATMAHLYADYTPKVFVPKLAPGQGVPAEYLPPPVFVPPKVPSKERPVPPFFMPPPLKKDKPLEPPMFTPPPLEKKLVETEAKPNSDKPVPAIPGFVPPPLTKEKPATTAPSSKSKPASTPVAPPMFTPPPIK